jgi:hypothetical protein
MVRENAVGSRDLHGPGHSRHVLSKEATADQGPHVIA